MPKNAKDRPNPPSRVPEFLAGDIGGDLLGDVAEALDLTDVLAEALREQWEARALRSATDGSVAKGSQAARARRKRLSSLRQPVGAWAFALEDDDAPHPQD